MHSAVKPGLIDMTDFTLGSLGMWIGDIPNTHVQASGPVTVFALNIAVSGMGSIGPGNGYLRTGNIFGISMARGYARGRTDPCRGRRLTRISAPAAAGQKR